MPFEKRLEHKLNVKLDLWLPQFTIVGINKYLNNDQANVCANMVIFVCYQLTKIGKNLNQKV